MPKNSDYYLKNASGFGWGRESASLDKERIKLLDKFTLGKKVLDVGCGSGVYVDYLSRKGFDAYGVDFVEKFIKKARKEYLGTFIKGRIQNLLFEDLEFDSLILFNILEHGDDKKLLNESKRVAKRRILVIVPKIVDETLEKSGVIFRHYLDKSHQREYHAKDLQKISKNAGLKLVHLQALHPLYNETIFLALFGGPIFFKKIVRKIVFAILPKKNYPTEIFAVFDKT